MRPLPHSDAPPPPPPPCMSRFVQAALVGLPPEAQLLATAASNVAVDNMVGTLPGSGFGVLLPPANCPAQSDSVSISEPHQSLEEERPAGSEYICCSDLLHAGFGADEARNRRCPRRPARKGVASSSTPVDHSFATLI